VATTFWFETPADAQQGADCTLPTPATPTRFIPAEPKVQVRRPVADLAESAHAEELKALREAVDLVRKLPDSDVTSWNKQVAQHCVRSNPSVAGNIHANWQFFPWHRAFLYFHERILRIQSKNDDLRLAYWDWENLGNRTVPKIYAEEGQPLYWANRTITGPEWPLTLDVVDVQPLLAIPTFDVFGGTAKDAAPVPAALSGPWANVHNAFDPGDLANLPLAPRDPLFFAHLCNFDRLWTSWIAMGHVNPDFGDARVYFYDENKEWCYVLQNDLRNEARLGYRYPSLMQPTVPASTFSSWQARRTATGFVIGDPDLAAIKERIGVPKILILQNIRRLETLTPGSVKYGVFAGPVIAGRPGTSQPTYLGMVSRVRSKDRNQVGPVSAALNVTSRLSLILDKKLVGLRVAALDHAGKTMGLGIPLAADSISLMG
jgi:hypothetical protein